MNVKDSSDQSISCAGAQSVLKLTSSISGGDTIINPVSTSPQESNKHLASSPVAATLNFPSSSKTLIVKELEKFDPTTPEEEVYPRKSKERGTWRRLQPPKQETSWNNTQLHGASVGASGVITSAAATNSNGILALLAHTVRDEKILGLWKGITPSLTRCVPGVGLYFATIHGLKITFDLPREPTPFQSFLLGATGSTISGVMMIPFTVIKTRFESTVYHYSSIRGALLSIYRKEGVRGLTCGLLPTLLRDAPFSGLYLLMYTSTKKTVPQDLIDSPTLGPYLRFSCGIVAGIGASLVTQPADVIKTKMQLYPDKFHNIPQVVQYVYKKYGAQGYFKGLLPRMIRRTLIAAMSWTVYEQMMKSIGLK